MTHISTDTAVARSSIFSRLGEYPLNQSPESSIENCLHRFEQFLMLFQEAGTSFQNREEMSFATQVLDFVRRKFDEERLDKTPYIALDDINRAELLETICQQIRALIALGNTLDMRVEAALEAQLLQIGNRAVAEEAAAQPSLSPLAAIDFSKFV